VFEIESSSLRLAKLEKCESRYSFCKVFNLKINKKYDRDEHFKGKHNKKIGLSRQTLIKKGYPI